MKLSLAGLMLSTKSDAADELANMTVDTLQCILLRTTSEVQATLLVHNVQVGQRALSVWDFGRCWHGHLFLRHARSACVCVRLQIDNQQLETRHPVVLSTGHGAFMEDAQVRIPHAETRLFAWIAREGRGLGPLSIFFSKVCYALKAASERVLIDLRTMYACSRRFCCIFLLLSACRRCCMRTWSG